MRQTKKTHQAILFLLSAIPVVAHSGVPLPLAEALSAEDYVSAFRLASESKTELVGDPEFDHAYGVAALRSGHTSEAVFALERVTVNEPGNLDARLDLAEAYLLLGNRGASIQELGQANQLQASAEQSDRLRDLAARAGPVTFEKPSGWTGDIGLSVGYDSNINNATGDDLLSLPGLGDITLDQSATEIDDSFVQLGFRLDHSGSLGSDARTAIAIDGYHREYVDDDDYDLDDLNLAAGVSTKSDDSTYAVQGRIRPTWRGGDLYRSIYSLAGELGKASTGSTDYDFGLQWSYLDYEDDPLLDRHQVLASVGLTHKAVPLVHQAMLYGGSEWADHDAGDYNARDLAGITYRLTYSAAGDSRSFAQVFYQYAGYKAEDPAYDETRDDNLLGISLGHDWRAARNLTVFGRYFYYDNSSNLDLYDYDRHQIQAGVRYRF